MAPSPVAEEGTGSGGARQWWATAPVAPRAAGGPGRAGPTAEHSKPARAGPAQSQRCGQGRDRRRGAITSWSVRLSAAVRALAQRGTHGKPAPQYGQRFCTMAAQAGDDMYDALLTLLALGRALGDHLPARRWLLRGRSARNWAVNSPLSAVPADGARLERLADLGEPPQPPQPTTSKDADGQRPAPEMQLAWDSEVEKDPDDKNGSTTARPRRPISHALCSIHRSRSRIATWRRFAASTMSPSAPGWWRGSAPHPWSQEGLDLRVERYSLMCP